MKLEKIAQLIDIASNNNTTTSKNMMKSPSSDILSYNLVAGTTFVIAIVGHFTIGRGADV